MKRFFISLIICAFPMLSNAQPGGFEPERLSDDEILRMQTRDIVSWLNLDDNTKDKFIKEYSAFRKEIDAVSKSAAAPVGTDNEADIDKALQKNFEVSEKILDIRKKYYARFKTFMQPSQIREMYRIENESGRRMQNNPPMPPHHGEARPDNGRPDGGRPDGGRPDNGRPMHQRPDFFGPRP